MVSSRSAGNFFLLWGLVKFAAWGFSSSPSGPSSLPSGTVTSYTRFLKIRFSLGGIPLGSERERASACHDPTCQHDRVSIDPCHFFLLPLMWVCGCFGIHPSVGISNTNRVINHPDNQAQRHEYEPHWDRATPFMDSRMFMDPCRHSLSKIKAKRVN